ncbi:MAG: biotin carboxylase N-terminal domain-containing protein [Polyangiales bacterium]
MSRFATVLVANRGEIACRVLRAARALGYRGVAVYSDADASAPHVALADSAVRLPGNKASDTYLRAELLIDAAKRAGADAVHPGYGFLSENAEFAEACERAGLVFIGPPASAIRLMGDKAKAKARMQEAGVPVVPGASGQLDAEAAARVGFPLLVKATAGGGGRGIRIVRSASELAEALESARVEAQSAFGNPELMLERFVERGRHVEVQVFADEHGNVAQLGERDCTAQRRRQKVIEEAPSPIVGEALRARMGEAAVAAARAVGYRGAGTIEFIVDQAGEPFFLEMNTRLQVEHPVTELVTGLDLVELQLRVAAGEALSKFPSSTNGHAIEARLYAEDPYAGFTPQTGKVLRFDVERASAPGVRIDAGVETGSEVTPFYDAMIAKVIAHGSTREDATRRLRHALQSAALFGPRTNARFLCDLLASEEFTSARMHTSMLDGWDVKPPEPSPELWALAFVLRAGGSAEPVLRSASVAELTITLACEGQTRSARVRRLRDGWQVGQHGVQILARGEREVRYELQGVRSTRSLLCTPDTVQLAEAGSVFVFQEPSALRSAQAKSDPTRVVAPLAGTLARIVAPVGSAVQPGELLLVVEAMKMEVKVFAGCAGTVKQHHRQAGEQVAANELLIELEA